MEVAIRNSSDVIMYHYNQWNIDRKTLEKAIEELFDFSIYVYGATHKSDDIEFDFYLLHLVTSMHAIRIIYSYLNNKKIVQHILLQFIYFAIAVYICKLRPEINENFIDNYIIDTATKNWDYVIDRTLNTKLAEDVHLVKIIYSLREAEKVYGNKNGFYLKAAVKTVDNLDPDNTWILEPNDPRQLNIITQE